MDRITYENQWQKLSEKFTPEYMELAKYDPIANKIIEMLIRGGDPYQAIEQLITINNTLLKELSRLHEIMPPTPRVI